MYNFAYTIMENSTKNPLIINLKGKLQKPFDFFLRYAVFGLLTCQLKYQVILSC